MTKEEQAQVALGYLRAGRADWLVAGTESPTVAHYAVQAAMLDLQAQIEALRDELRCAVANRG
jgi:hypothetical protein